MSATPEKAKAWSLAGTIVEAAVSVVPVFGGPAAVVTNRLFNMPIQQRNDRIMTAIQADIATLMQQFDSFVPDEVLSSEEFMAALHRSFRAAQETSSDDKRKLLRNALLNGYVLVEARPRADVFLQLISRYEVGHIVVLRAIQTLMAGRTEALGDAQTLVQRHLAARGQTAEVPGCFRALINDGLVFVITENEVYEQGGPPARFGSPIAKQVTRTTKWHNITEEGISFLEFLEDPLLKYPD
ncbi:hypothetical protein KIV56_00925 [Cryobacterium breve]|uniref:DUF4393 domain-containing protein n=1 Tax=Cryobacterium breve TaxID=1259258 RepID=A0ABY7ND31_9MICO|nr:hypothetical protein [Cryobacterium breve]WBM80184.1 hypothetical protein KIV56_00925 [Cryobacterium breve]